MTDKVKVLVIEAHPIMRIGLESVLRSAPDIELVGMCDTGTRAVAMCAQLQPTVAIMDVVLPDMSGVEACRAIKRATPQTDILVFTACDDNATVFRAVGAGATGYVLKDISSENLLRAVHAVQKGQTMVNPGITRRMLEHVGLMAKDGGEGSFYGEKLSAREIEILAEVAKGATNKEIARKFFISESTVKSRLRGIFSKIEVRDRAQAAAYAMRVGYTR